MSRIDGFLEQIVATKFQIFDPDTLKRQIEYQQLAFDAEKTPLCWLFELLRNGAGQIDNIENYGVRARPEYKDQSLVSIKKDIDDGIYELACAYYQRYVVPGITTQGENLATEL